MISTRRRRSAFAITDTELELIAAAAIIGLSGALDRDVRAAAHRNPDVGDGQRLSVVDAVTGHCHAGAARLQLADDTMFVLRRNVRVNLVYAHLTRYRVRGRAAVAGDHHHPHARARPRR